jgi:TolB-like protein/Flp pilus assembly protein TadD
MASFFAELKRRKVYRVAIAYAVVSWLLIQIATQVFPFFEIPNWAVRLVISLLTLGFPVALLLSWAFDLTAKGIVRTEDVVPKPRLDERVPEKSIAVLPFENLSEDQQNTYFADGIQDDILSSLAKVADLKVISRTSVRQYRGGVRNLREIGAALGVAHILEGTVRRVGNRVRVNAQLINARNDSHVWGDSFDREMTDLFALQSELAEKIANALRANLSPSEKARIQVHPTADLDAYDLYLRARDLFRWSGAGDPRENGERALTLLEQALARDPQFALAHALASRFHSELYWFGYDRSRDRVNKAKTEAETALRIYPDLGDAHLALAYYHYYGFLDYELACKEIELARRATPNDAEIWDAAAAVNRRQSRWEDAVSSFQKARQLDPRNTSVIWNLAETYTCLRRYAEARRGFADGLVVNPHAYLFSLASAAIALKEEGNMTALRGALEKIPPDFDPGGAVTTVALRLSLMNRDYAQTERLLRDSKYDEFNDGGIGGTAGSLDGYTFPKTWYEGLVARGQGDVKRMVRAFESARRTVETDPRQCSEDAKTNSMLGLIDAALGRKEDALREGEHSVELLPTSKDAYDGPILATNLAVIYAQCGERDLALQQLADLTALPNGLTPGTLRVEPEWDPLRGDSRFEKLLAARNN